jgi:phenylacetate-CoA ligase
MPAGDRVFGQAMIKRLRFLEKAQWWDQDRLVEERNRSLSAIIRIAYEEVPLYRELMEGCRVRPSDISNQEDLSKLPVVTKDMLRAQYPQGVTRDTGQKTYELRTSGSTGANFCVRQDAFTAGWYRASFLLALQWAGWRCGESHLQTGMTFNRSLERRLKDQILGCHYIPASDLSNGRLDENLELLDRGDIRHLWGYPGSLYFLAQRAVEVGWNRPLTSVVTWGDNLYPHYRKVIEDAFGTVVHDTYGCAEGMQISAQCGESSFYHIHALDVIPEFLDDAGNPVPPGQPGKITLTRLHPGVMPFIRYHVGDVGILGDPSGCPCGRGFPTMHSIQGRDTDVVTTPSGHRLIVHFFTGILEHFREIDSFQVIQNNPETILLRIVPTELHVSVTNAKIVDELRKGGATGVDIEIELVEEIPLTRGGKRRFIISNV